MIDIPRPEFRRQRLRRQLAYGGGALVIVGAAAFYVSGLEPAAPTVPRASVWIESVREGEMLLQVRGPGRLVPREIRWIPAEAGGRVERIVVRPGAAVEEDTVLVELSSSELIEQTEEARLALVGAEANLAEMELRLHGQELDQRAAVGVARAEYEAARLQTDAERELAEDGIVPVIQFRRSELASRQMQIRHEIEQERLNQLSASMEAQLAAERARAEQAKNTYDRRLQQIEWLQVRAGFSGVLQSIEVETGQRVEQGSNVARVVRPDELQAELRIPETQARDVRLGQHVDVDTRNGIVKGVVSRIDPAVQEGTVLIDVELHGELPRGARPDLSVDGTVEIERIEHALYTGRPAYGQADSTITLFKLVEGGAFAVGVPVKFGRTSVNAIEILEGLALGDEVILSDTSSWDDYERIRLD
jgi:HlyD family secretion protein